MSEPDAQRRETLERWNHAAAGWGKHAAWLRETTAPLSLWLVDALQLAPGQTVLELAAGPGETGFIAAQRVGESGKLVSSDNSQAMLEIAQARAAELELTNVEFRLINEESIDLPVASVDAVVCRWGYMLAVDPAAALLETRRVLKPGGRAALAVWGSPAQNAWLSVPSAVLVERGLVPAPEAGPGPFALADRARLESLLTGAGFVEVRLDEIQVERGRGSFAEWWERHLDMSSSGPAVRAAAAEVQREIAAEVQRRLTDFTGHCIVAVAS